MGKRYLTPISLGKLNDLYDEVSAIPRYTRIMRRVRRGVSRKNMITDRTMIDLQQKKMIAEQIDVIEEWLSYARNTYL